MSHVSLLSDPTADTGETDQQPTHLDYYQAGYQPVPIIPPGARLSPYSKVSPSELGKIPGRQGAHGWASFDWLEQSRKPTRRALERWAETGAGIGLVCGEPDGVVGIDIDVLDEDAATLVQRVTEQVLGEAPRRVGRWPKRLLVYGVDMISPPIKTAKLRFRSGDESTHEHLIEIRGRGQQFVAEGVHPGTGQAYEWDRRVPPRDELVQVDSKQIHELIDALADTLAVAGWTVGRPSGGTITDRERVDQDQLVAEDLDYLDRAVGAIRNTTERFPDRDSYVRMAHAIKAAYRDDPARGEQAWLDWCARWDDPDGRENDPDTALADYRRCRPPFEVGAPYLYELAREDGFNDAARLFSAEPPAVPPDTDKGGGTGAQSAQPDADNASDDERRAREAFRYMLEDYVYVEEMDRFVCLSESYRRLLTPKTVSTRFARLGLGRVGSQTDNAVSHFLNHPASRRVVRVTYRPGDWRDFVDEGLMGTAVNIWRPGELTTDAATRMEVSDDGVRPWLDLVEHLIPDHEQRRVLLDWLAYCVQHPGGKPSWHVVLGGPQGCGKDTILQPVLRALGEHNTAQIQAGDLQNQWTDFLEGSALVVVQEMNNFERRSVMDRLKPLLAQPPREVRINTKNQPQYNLPNITAWVFLTNHEDAIALEHGDRRFYVLWSDEDAGVWSEQQFRELYRWMMGQESGWRRVAGWLAQRDLSAFNPQGQAPHTAAKERMRQLTASALQQTIEEIIECREGPAEPHPDLLPVHELKAYLEREHKLPPQQTTARKIGMALRALGAVNLGRFRYGPSGQARCRMWAVRNGSYWRREVEHGLLNAATLYYDEKEARDDNVIEARDKFNGPGPARGGDGEEENDDAPDQ